MLSRKTFRGMGEGTVVNPTKVGLDLGEIAAWPRYKGFMNAMPAYVGVAGQRGDQWAGGFLGTRPGGPPVHQFLILLIDPKNGQSRAVLDGRADRELRTGAQSAVALK